MKYLYTLALLATLLIYGCECEEGSKFQAGDLVVDSLTPLNNIVAGQVWQVACVIRNIADAIDECHSPAKTDEAEGLLTYMFRPEFSNPDDFVVVHRERFTVRPAEVGSIDPQEDIMLYPTSEPGYYKMDVSLNTGGDPVEEADMNNNSRSVTRKVDL